MAAVHETAFDLHRLGFIGMHKMKTLDELCLEPALRDAVALIETSRAQDQFSNFK